MTERRHNKMYREIAGYENAIDVSYAALDELEEAIEKLKYGYTQPDVLNSLDIAKDHIEEAIASVVSGGHKIK